MSAVEKATSGEYSEKYTKAITTTTTNQTAANSAAVTTKTKTTTTILKPYQKYNQQQQEQQQQQHQNHHQQQHQRQHQQQQHQHQQQQQHQQQRQYQQHSSPRHQQHNNHSEHQQQQPPYQIHHQNHHQHQHQYQYQYQQYPEKSVTTTTTTATETTTTKKPATNESGNDDTRSCIALEETSTSTRLVRPCLSHVLTVLFSTPGLVLLVILYSMMGGLLFPLLEAPQDINKSLAIAKSREDCLRELWIITEKLNVLYERNWTMLVHEQLRRFEGSIVAATRYGGLGPVDGEHDDGGSAVAERFGGQMDASLEARWTFSEALLYSVTVITTIGHGSLTPKTSAGKIATILYALIGVPLMLMCLSSLGALLADALQCTYARICCRLTRIRGRGTASKQHRISRCESRESEDVRRGGRMVDVGRVSDTEDSTNDRESHASQQKYEMDCKSCKYDAVMSETNPNKGYPNKYPVNGASLVRGKETDSCQLLHNSSMSVNHHSPCMQLKSATMAANGQYYHQQQQQQHHQHPDVMHLNAVCGNSSVMPPSPKLSSATYCSRSATPTATPSPKLLHHPLQQNYQLVSSAINSTPTHPDYVHMHSQHHQQLPHLYQQQQQQHFVAVPSNILRFQPAASPPNNAVLNFYQSSPIAIPGSATIYFPISAPSSTATTLASATGTATVLATGTTTPLGTTPPSGATTTTTATGETIASLAKTTLAVAVTNGTQVIAYPQPLVKYHTIQLQPKKPPPPPSYGVTDATEILTTNQGHVTFSLGDSTATETTTTTATAITSDTLPLPFPPPPPAYQTATVHGIRRAKFLTKPMPHGINTLLAETQISCRRDSSQNCNTSTSESAVTATRATTTTNIPTTAMTSVHPTLTTSALTATSLNSTAGGETTTSFQPIRKGSPALATTTTTTLVTANMNGSNTAVDIMEDEEESEQHRMGSCPHGTPSRVPLISSVTGRRNPLTTDGSTHKEGGAGKTAALLSRGLMNSTAASFHRHTLNTFQRGGGGDGNRRTAFIQSRRNCSVHRLKGGTSYNVTGGCYGDTTETSDDDDYLPHGSADFVLNGEEEDDDEDDSEDGVACDRQRDSDSVPQVPISIVLLILVCYICLGTVIFAFWENWSLIDGAYFCFVTLSTIGYGDFRPERTFNGPEVQLFACCAYLLLGLVLVAMSFSILETQLMWKCKRIAVRLKLAKD